MNGLFKPWLRHPIGFLLLVIMAGAGVLAAPSTAPAEPMKPALSEAATVAAALRFRSDMMVHPEEAVRLFSEDLATRRQFNAIGEAMAEVGSGDLGWRYLLGTSIFAAEGLDRSRTLVAFYNPWIDAALITIWKIEIGERKIIDVEWVPGDMVRAPNAGIVPQPLWLRGRVYRPQAVVDAVVTTVRAIETRLPERGVEDWRQIINTGSASAYQRFVLPLLAARLYETQMRLKALVFETNGEDPLLESLRAAVGDLIRSARTEGFSGLLAQAGDTTEPMRAALGRIHPWTMQGIAPVAFVAGQGHATVFLASTVTADFVLSARFAERDSSYELRQLEYLPYAAVYQATVTGEAD